MKNTQKLIAILLVVVMTLALGTAAFAAGTGKITISNAFEGETYTLYKVFDAVGDGTGATGHMSYKLVSGKDAAPAGFSVDTAGNVTYNGTNTELTAADIAAIAAYVEGDTAVATKVAEGTTVEFTGLDDGYYYIATSAGTVVIIDSNNHNVTVTEKNEEPTIDKTVEEDSTGAYSASNDAQIGDTVNFKTTIKAQKGAKNYVMHDKMEDGLTFNNDVAIAGLTEGTNYTVVTEGLTDGCTFHIVFTETYLNSIDAKDTEIVVTYSAVLNENAEISDGTNDNEAKLTYGEKSSTEWDKTETSTYKFELVKTDDHNKQITGAKFKLYDAATEGHEIPVVKVSDGVYRPAVDGETGVEIEAGKVTIQGLNSADYYLEETQAPDGYNKLTTRQKVTIDGANLTDVEMDATDPTLYSKGGVQVINNAGTLLPSTGGIGTTIFYIVGAILLVGAGVILITKKRVGEEG